MKKILSVDDEPAMLTCLKHVLEGSGYELFVTSDPEEALRILHEEDIALFLLEVHMPKKDGFHLYEEIRQFASMPVLFVTAYPKALNPDSKFFKRIWEEEFVDGLTDVIYKPFKLEILVEKVEGLIGAASDEPGQDS